MIKNIFKVLAIFLLAVGGGIFASQILRPLFWPEQNSVYLTERKEIIIQENAALKNAIEKTAKTVIGVRTKIGTGEILDGSGLIITADGLVVTSADLVPQGAAFSFYIDGSSTAYQILKRDLKENLALVKIGEVNLPTLSFANLEKIKLGERVFLVGVASSSLTVNEGIIRNFDDNFIETNIIESVNLAGSPLFNIEGQVLGLNTIQDGKVITIPVSKIKTFIGF